MIETSLERAGVPSHLVAFDGKRSDIPRAWLDVVHVLSRRAVWPSLLASDLDFRRWQLVRRERRALR